MSTTEQAGWPPEKCAAWYAAQPQIRDYQQDIVARVRAITLPPSLVVAVYGTVEGDDLICVTPAQVDSSKPSLIVSGGVHGYEPEGIEACIRLVEGSAPEIAQKTNLFLYPCVTPAAYRIHHRWTYGANDVNREFTDATRVAEAKLLMGSVEADEKQFQGALDCHTTPPEDRWFRRLRAERYGTPLTGDPDLLPNGFHLMVPEIALQNAQTHKVAQTIIKAVSRITPIATDEQIVGNINQGGIVPSTAQGTLTRWMNDRAAFAATTEVVTEGMIFDEGVAVQMAAIKALARAIAP